MILALSSTGDVTTDYVIAELVGASKSVVRLNTDTLLTEWQISSDRRGFVASSDVRSFRASDVTSVYYRRAQRPRPHPRTHQEAELFAYREARVMLRGLYSQLRCPWISHHLAVTAAENRLAQMYLASEIGFNVPDWSSTNNPQEAERFFREQNRVIVKALSYGALGGGRVAHTSLVRNWSSLYADDIAICPVLLQAFVEKRYEYRVTVVDDIVFSCRIDSQSDDAYAVDMRRGLMDAKMLHEPVALPKAMQTLCVQIVQALALRFGAIDIVEDKRGAFWFLEVNPTGQWAWIEDRVELPIARTIAMALAGD